MVVESEPGDPDAEEEYNRWYREDHIPELLAVPGFVAARRYQVRRDLTAGESSKPTYLAVYELEADDLAAPLTEMRARSRARRAAAGVEGTGGPRPALSASTVVTVYELVEE